MKNLLDKIQFSCIYFPIAVTLTTGFLIIYTFITYKAFFHSDDAVISLLAREMIEEKTILSTYWNYSNGDFWLLHKYIFIAPFLSIYDASFFISSLASFISTILFIYLAHVILKAENVSRSIQIIGFILVFGLIPPYLVEFLYGQSTYLWLTMCFLLLSFLSASILKTTHFNYRYCITSLSYIFIFFTILLSNFNRSLVYFVVPIYGSILINRLVEKEEKIFSYSIFSISSIFTITLAYSAYHSLLGEINMYYDAASIKIASTEQIQRNFKIFIEGWLFNSKGFLDYYRATIMNAVLLAPVIQAINLRKIKSYLHRLLLIAYIINLVSIFSFYILTTSLAKDALSLRYFLVAILTSIILFLLSLKNFISILKSELSKEVAIKLVFIITIPVLVSCYFTFVDQSFLINHYHIGLNKNKYEGLKNFLIEKNLKYGYASYWNSSVITVLSSEKVAVRPIYIETLNPMRLISSNRWYSLSYYNGRTFLILDQSQLYLLASKRYKLLGIPKEQYNFMNFSILVYDFNIGSMLKWQYLIDLGKGFYAWESDEKLVWSNGDAVLSLRNEYKIPKSAKIKFTINTLLPRQVIIMDSDQKIMELDVKPSQPQILNFTLNLEPGKNYLQFKTDKSAQLPGNGDPRKLAFSITDIELVID